MAWRPQGSLAAEGQRRPPPATTRPGRPKDEPSRQTADGRGGHRTGGRRRRRGPDRAVRRTPSRSPSSLNRAAGLRSRADILIRQPRSRTPPAAPPRPEPRPAGADPGPARRRRTGRTGRDAAGRGRPSRPVAEADASAARRRWRSPASRRPASVGRSPSSRPWTRSPPRPCASRPGRRSPVRLQEPDLHRAGLRGDRPDEPQVEDAIAYLEIALPAAAAPVRPTPPRVRSSGAGCSPRRPAVNPLEHPIYDAWVVGCKA